MDPIQQLGMMMSLLRGVTQELRKDKLFTSEDVRADVSTIAASIRKLQKDISQYYVPVSVDDLDESDWEDALWWALSEIDPQRKQKIYEIVNINKYLQLILEEKQGRVD